MSKFLAVGAIALFSFMVAGTAMAQERPVLQDGFAGTGAAGGVDNAFMLKLLAKPETIYGRLWGKDMASGKIYVETGGGALVTIKLGPETNVENIKALAVGNDVEVQAKRNYRRLGTGAFAADIPDGDPIALAATVIREAPVSNQAGFNPDTDRAIFSRDASDMGGVGGQCFQCHEGRPSDYK